MLRVPTKPGLAEHEQNKAGRAELLATPFATFERNIRDQLARTLGAGGFDPARDIEAITVNRWPHGYAPEYNPLFEPELPPDQQPHVVGRAKFGRIVIANSDAGRRGLYGFGDRPGAPGRGASCCAASTAQRYPKIRTDTSR